MGQIIAGGEQFETAIAADYRGRVIRSGIDSGEVDAFARKRVSEPYTLFDSTLRYDKRAVRLYQLDFDSAGSGPRRGCLKTDSEEHLRPPAAQTG